MGKVMSAITLQQMADRVADLMESRLKVGGKGLSEKLKRGGNKLPRRVRAAAADLAKAADLARNPKLFLQLDQAAIAEAYDLCLRHLGELHRWDRVRGLAESWLLSLVTSLIVLGGLIFAVLRWRGYV